MDRFQRQCGHGSYLQNVFLRSKLHTNLIHPPILKVTDLPRQPHRRVRRPTTSTVDLGGPIRKEHTLLPGRIDSPGDPVCLGPLVQSGPELETRNDRGSPRFTSTCTVTLRRRSHEVERNLTYSAIRNVIPETFKRIVIFLSGCGHTTGGIPKKKGKITLLYT